MDFTNHWNLVGKHAFLSPSKHSWMNYDLDDLVASYNRYNAASHGTRLHDLAKELIDLKVRLPKNGSTLSMFVNDAIMYRMIPEQPLYYSEFAFGTADAISYRRKLLRISDLKTGTTKVSMNQLIAYAALFFLEYELDVKDTTTELRIYQNDEVVIHEPELDEILPVMDKIVSFSSYLSTLEG